MRLHLRGHSYKNVMYMCCISVNRRRLHRKKCPHNITFEFMHRSNLAALSLSLVLVHEIPGQTPCCQSSFPSNPSSRVEGPGLKWTRHLSAQDLFRSSVRCSWGCNVETPTMLCRRQATLGPGIPVVPKLLTTIAGGAAVLRFHRGLPGRIT